MLNEYDRDLINRYNAMSEEEKKSYLDENKIIILDDYISSDDGRPRLVAEVSDKLVDMLTVVMSERNLDTLDDAMSLVLSELIKKHASKED